jgi:hypothetical protein
MIAGGLPALGCSGEGTMSGSKQILFLKIDKNQNK